MSRSTFEVSAAAADELDRLVAAVAALMAADLDALTARVAEHINAEMPELGEHARVTGRTLAAVRSSLTGFTAFMRGGVPSTRVEISPDTVDYARAFVHRGIGLPAAIRCFRLGHEQMWRAWAEAIDASKQPPELRTLALEVVSASMFQFIDQTTTALVDEYQAERERWNRSADARRAETVAAILAGETVEPDTASRQLGYDLRLWHLGVVLWSDGEGEGEARLIELQRAAVELGESIARSSRPLVLAAGGSVVWAWLGTVERPDEGLLDAVAGGVRKDGVSIAVGEPAAGVEGFRRTHQSAVLARRVSRLASKPPRTAQRFRSLALVSLLSADLEQMRRFVADELADLAADDDATSRLRATLSIYLDERSSAAKTGRRLGVHTNTINYRIRRCAELIGHPVHERRGELEAALRLKQALGPAAFHDE